MRRLFVICAGFAIFAGFLNADNVVILPKSHESYSLSIADGARGRVDSSLQDSRESILKSNTATLQKFSIKSKNLPQNIAPNPTPSIALPKPKNAKIITISFVGDIILGDYLGAEGATFDAKFAEVNGNFRYFGSGVSAILQNDDLTVGNLEGVLSDKRLAVAKDKSFVFKGRESYAKILRFAGVDLVNLANNHTRDYGAQGLKDTMNALQKARVRFFGEENVALIRIKGVKFGFAGEKGWGLWAKEAIKRDIESLRKKGAEIVIFSFHFGVEKSNTPSAIQRELAHFAIDNGADLVVGHHSHTLQGIEEYKGKKIAYSLANFIYGGSKRGGDKDSMIYQAQFIFSDELQNKMGANLWCDECDNDFVDSLKSIDTLGKNAIVVHNIIPISVSSRDLLNDYRPQIYPKNSEGFGRIINRLNEYSKVIRDLDLTLDSSESALDSRETNKDSTQSTIDSQ